MKLFILKTDINCRMQAEELRPHFENDPLINRWTVDYTDIDHVLKIETIEDFEEDLMILKVRKLGHYCEALPD